jgi:hypothetical protein
MCEPTSQNGERGGCTSAVRLSPRHRLDEWGQLRELRRAILRMHPDHAGGDPRAQAEFARLVNEYKRLSARQSERRVWPQQRTQRRHRRSVRLACASSGLLLISVLVLGWWAGKSTEAPQEPVLAYPPRAVVPAVQPVAQTSLARGYPFGDGLYGGVPDIPLDCEKHALPWSEVFPYDAPWLMAPLDEGLVPFRRTMEALFARRSGLESWPPPMPLDDLPTWKFPPGTVQGRFPAGPDFVRQAEEAARRIAPE